MRKFVCIILDMCKILLDKLSSVKILLSLLYFPHSTNRLGVNMKVRTFQSFKKNTLKILQLTNQLCYFEFIFALYKLFHWPHLWYFFFIIRFMPALSAITTILLMASITSGKNVQRKLITRLAKWNLRP